MELLSIILARAIYLLEVDSLDPFGKQTDAESAATLKDRYSFARFPESIAEITVEKGAEFSSGRLGGIAIDKLVLYPSGIMVDTRSSTDDAEKVAQDLIDAARDLLGARVTVERKHLVSQFTFRSQMRLGKMNAVLDEIAEHIEKSLSLSLKQPFKVETTGVVVNVDLTQSRIVPAKFTIERRAEAPFAENIYFASAPLNTGLHLELVERFEKSIL